MSFIKNTLSTASLLTIIVLMASCDSNFKKIQKINSVPFFASGEAENIQLKYVDSGSVKAILISPKMLEYSQVKFPFTEFPKGIHLTMLDKENNKNLVVADYAIRYSSKDLIDLRGNVVITSHDGKKLETDQLYYDQANDWFYTEKFYKISDIDNSFTEGVGIDFDSKFQTVTAQNSYAERNKTE
ncbi:LPS export ABC transporter periplasmic protein LptC [Flavobacterium sp. JP2137]|uniref:LPS export ABC transporter periplasmic protein LptC n=1 Tax=Flavobacterium sp. JP2137 TaxID=3414510 RepID=UPI003D300E37